MTTEIGGFYQSNIYKKEKKNNVLVWVFWEGNTNIVLIVGKKMVFLGKRGHCTSVYKAFAEFMYCECFPNLCFGLFISVRGFYEEQTLHNFMYCTSIKISPIATSFCLVINCWLLQDGGDFLQCFLLEV